MDFLTACTLFAAFVAFAVLVLGWLAITQVGLARDTLDAVNRLEERIFDLDDEEDEDEMD